MWQNNANAMVEGRSQPSFTHMPCSINVAEGSRALEALVSASRRILHAICDTTILERMRICGVAAIPSLCVDGLARPCIIFTVLSGLVMID
jgi:hypothetical protein